MSIQSEITRLSGNVSDALDAIEAKGVTIPSGSNSDDLADLIAQISGGGGSGGGVIVQDEDGYLVLSPNEANAVRVSRTADSHGGDIVSIEADTSSGGGWTTDGIASRTEPSGALTFSGTSIGNYAFTYNAAITDMTGDSITSIGIYAFAYATGLEKVIFRNWQGTTTTNNNVFGYAGDINKTVIVLPSLVNFGSRMFNRGGYKAIDIGPNSTGTAGADTWYHNTGDQTVGALILRRTSGVVEVQSEGAINGLRDVWVPSALKSSYEAATNWSTRVSGGYITFHTIEGSQYENYYADGTPIN